MKSTVLLIASLGLAGCGIGQVGPTVDDAFETGFGVNQALPVGITPANVVAFRSAVTGAGCAVSSPAQTRTVASQTGLGTDKLRLIVDYLTQTGEVAPTTNGYRLTSGQCANV